MTERTRAIVAKLIRMLSSPSEAERLTAARKLVAIGVHEIAAVIEANENDDPLPSYGSKKYRRRMSQRILELRLKQEMKENSELRGELRRLRSRKCAVCGESFAGRSGARTCSKKCRARLHRLRHKGRGRANLSRTENPLTCS